MLLKAVLLYCPSSLTSTYSNSNQPSYPGFLCFYSYFSPVNIGSNCPWIRRLVLNIWTVSFVLEGFGTALLFVLEVSCHLYCVCLCNYALLDMCKVSCTIKLFVALWYQVWCQFQLQMLTWEGFFPMLRKGQTDQGSTLKQSTIDNFNMTLYKFLWRTTQ